MGAGACTRSFYGVPLEDARADVLLGLVDRYQQGTIHLPDDPPTNKREVPSRPWEPVPGRLWIGVALDSAGSPLPTDRRDRVWSRGAVEVRGVVRETTRSQLAWAMHHWEVFAAWCARRGVELPPAAAYVVADYD